MSILLDNKCAQRRRPCWSRRVDCYPGVGTIKRKESERERKKVMLLDRVGGPRLCSTNEHTNTEYLSAPTHTHARTKIRDKVGESGNHKQPPVRWARRKIRVESERGEREDGLLCQGYIACLRLTVQIECMQYLGSSSTRVQTHPSVSISNDSHPSRGLALGQVGPRFQNICTRSPDLIHICQLLLVL